MMVLNGSIILTLCDFAVIGFEVAAPGIEQYKEFVEEAKNEKDEVISHSYYQWVSSSAALRRMLNAKFCLCR